MRKVNLIAAENRLAARSYVVTKDIRTKKGEVFERGTQVTVVEYKDRYPYSVRVQDDAGRVIAIPPSAGHKYLKGFPKPPSMSTMERWMDDGVAKALDGSRVEPDGVARSGAPSWLLALGMI